MGKPIGILLIIVGLILVIVGVGSYSSYSNTSQNPNSTTAIATNTPVTTQDISNATNTEQNPYPPGGGTLAFDDPLNDNQNSWCNSLDSSEWHFSTDGLHVTSTGEHGGGGIDCIVSNTDFSDFAYQVQMTILKGSGDILFRSDPNPFIADPIYFAINKDGTYRLSGNGGGWHTGSSSVVNFDKSRTYLIGVVAQGKNFDLYINLQLVASVHDTNFAREQGAIGVGAITDGTPSDVVFKYAKVWTF